jgi:hypothetical protein
MIDESRVTKYEIDPEGQAIYWSAMGGEIHASIWYALRDGHIDLETANELAGRTIWYEKENI